MFRYAAQITNNHSIMIRETFIIYKFTGTQSNAERYKDI